MEKEKISVAGFIKKQQIEKVLEKELQQGISSGLLPEDQEFCKGEVKKIGELAPDRFAEVFTTLSSLSVLNLLDAEKEGKIKVGRLVMNRKPKKKSVEALAKTIIEVGMHILILVIPATVAVRFGYKIEDFDGNPIPESELGRTVIIIDGQTRFSAIRKIMKDNPNQLLPGVYAYFPLHWISLTKMLQAINLKVFTWTNSDFISGLRGLGCISEDVEKALSYIQSLEQKGYNYTGACEWVILEKGIIRKTTLVKAMNKPESVNLEYDNSEYGMEIHQEAQKVFVGKNEDALKNKTLPELIIREWKDACEDLSKKEATGYIKAFLNSLTSEDISEMVSPADYKRGEGKKKEAFVKERFDESFKSFKEAYPYADFRESFKTTGL